MFCAGTGWFTCMFVVALIPIAYSDPYSITEWYPVVTQTDVKESTLWLNGGFQHKPEWYRVLPHPYVKEGAPWFYWGFQQKPEFFPAMTHSYDHDAIQPSNWGFQHQPEFVPVMQHRYPQDTPLPYWGFQRKPEPATAAAAGNVEPSTGAGLGAPLAAAEGAAVSLEAGGARPVALSRAGSHESQPAQTSSTAPTVIGPSPYPTSQPRSNHGSRQSPATPEPTMAVQPTIKADNDQTSSLRSLSPAEKGRRLIEAARNGAVEELEALLAAGADVGSREEGSSMTALHHAANRGHEEAARLLLAAGAAVGARDRLKWTPLHEAAAQGHAAVVRLLLDSGADHSARNRKGGTPLHAAARNGKAEAVAALLAAGAERAAMDDHGATPLDLAKLNGHLQAVDLLLGNSSRTTTELPK